MDTQRWQQIQDQFEATRTLPLQQQIALLRSSCGDDVDLFDEVLSLLQAAAMTAGPFDRLQADFAPVRHLVRTPLPDTIGAYRIVQEIGRGGMGTVYRAERADRQYEKTVAIKLVRHTFAGPDLVGRFVKERQMLARLEHPNITRFYEGGITREGFPYLVMEYVEGLPLLAYCDHHRLSIEDRIQLFCTVCEAVHYAHQHLIIHRDLKPSNILVTEDGRPKLLDFGIAKELPLPAPDEDGLSVRAQTVQDFMTTVYAAPEQVQQRPISTACDVYALGVILYELLTGRRPFALDDQTPSEIERIISSEPPPRPSTVVPVPPHPEADTVLGLRRTHARELKRRLQGDLDTIVLMALRKEPERRYHSAAQLAEDLQNHLALLPVSAHRDSVRYRATKFIRRYRTGVAATILIGVLLLAAVVLINAQAVRVAEEQRNTVQVVDLMTRLLRMTGPYARADSIVTRQDLADVAGDWIDEELRDQPDLQAQLLKEVAEVYAAYGSFSRAESTYTKALLIQKRIYPEDHPEITDTYFALGLSYLNRSASQASADVLQKVLHRYRTTYGEQDEHTAAAYTFLSKALMELDRFAEADTLLDHAESVYRALFGDQHSGLANALQYRGQIHLDHGGYQEAERYFSEALTIRREHDGETDAKVANSLDALGHVYLKQQRYEEADSLFREALSIRTQLFGPTHPDRATSYESLGLLHWAQGEKEEAKALLEKARALYADAGHTSDAHHIADLLRSLDP